MAELRLPRGPGDHGHVSLPLDPSMRDLRCESGSSQCGSSRSSRVR